MELICQHDKNAEREKIEVPRVPCVNGLLRADEVLQSYHCQGREGNEAVVAICFNKVMSGDGCWVHMMFSEWTNKSLEKEKK